MIGDLRKIQELCRDNGITPVLLTLAPINPGNIEKAFDEPRTATGRNPSEK